MTFVSFAQNCEDVILWRALKTVEHGFYIDVGAAWPTFHSVTRAFYDRGWNGINIEPNPRLLSELNRERPRDLNLGVAIGREPGEVDVRIMSNEGLSTVVDRIAEEHVSNGFAQTSVRVPMTTLAAICAAHVDDGQPIHFLKVDVEGFEAAALSGNDWTRFRPWIVAVEAMEPMRQVENHQEWEAILVAAGYSFSFADGLNRYYVADERPDLVASFAYPPNIFDQYITVDMQQVHLAVAALEGKLEEARREAEQLRRDLNLRGNECEEARREVEQLRRDLNLRGNEREEARREVEQLRRDLNLHENALEEARRAAQLHARKADLDRYRAERSLVEALLFHADGRPRRLVRQMFFHADGRCRRLMRCGVFNRRGQPRQIFRRWLQSEQYLALPGAGTL